MEQQQVEIYNDKTDKVLLIEVESPQFLEPIQIMAYEEFKQEYINSMQKMLRADPKILEIMNQKQKNELKKPNIARKTAKPIGSIQINDGTALED